MSVNSPRPSPMAVPLLSGRGLYAWFIMDGYLFDWIVAGVAIIINLTVPGGAVKPTNRFYQDGDPTISYPARDGTISSGVLYAITFALPFTVYMATALFRRSFHDG